METKTELSRLVSEDLQKAVLFCAAHDHHGRGEEFWRKRFQHWWTDNPSMSSEWVMGVKLVEGDAIVGINCCIPLNTSVNGEPHFAAARSTWRVSKECRGHSLSVIMFADTLVFDRLNFSSTSIDSMLPILKYSGWTLIRSEIVVTTLVASLYGVFRGMLKLGGSSQALPSFVSMHSKLSIDEAQQAANETWQATRHQCAHGPVRDAAYFRWYALLNPTMPFTWFAVKGDTPESSLFALATHYGDGTLHVMDFWPWNASVKSYQGLVRLITKTARRHGFRAIHIPHLSPNIRKACTPFRLARTRITPQRFYAHAPEGMNLPAEGGCWPMNCGDIGI